MEFCRAGAKAGEELQEKPLEERAEDEIFPLPWEVM